MFHDTIIKILEYCWPMIIICSVILVSMRIVDIIKNKKKFIFYNEVLTFGFIIYIMCLFYVVTFQDVSWGSSNFVIFKEMFRYEIGTNLFFKNVIGNMLMFVPFGFFVSYFLKLKKPYSILGFTILTSVTIEIIQLCIGRVFDIDDIILNMIGGLLGFILYYLIIKFKDKLPKKLQKDYIYNIFVILVILILIIYLIGGIYV